MLRIECGKSKRGNKEIITDIIEIIQVRDIIGTWTSVEIMKVVRNVCFFLINSKFDLKSQVIKLKNKDHTFKFVLFLADTILLSMK